MMRQCIIRSKKSGQASPLICNRRGTIFTVVPLVSSCSQRHHSIHAILTIRILFLLMMTHNWRLICSFTSQLSSRNRVLRASTKHVHLTTPATNGPHPMIRREYATAIGSSSGRHEASALNSNNVSEKPTARDIRAARAKRKRKIGLAKGVDRGLSNVPTYQPAVITKGPSYLNKFDFSYKFQALTGLPDQSRPFTVLGIETSCDDTGCAVVRSDGVILGESLQSQAELHEPWGGVVPGLARRAHEQAVEAVIQEALHKAGLQSVQEVDAVAVTIGPGLELCLRVGCQAAVVLAELYKKPFVGVHHLEAHILMARLPYPRAQLNGADTNNDIKSSPKSDPHNVSQRAIRFPFLALLVSGGHCQLMHCHNVGHYEILGGTIDDSLGEAYDKTARLLGLPVGGGGGPAVEEMARKGDPKAVPLTIPMQQRKDCDFSFAGLKSNVRREAAKLVQCHNNNQTTSVHIELPDQLPNQDKANIAASFQRVAIRHVEDRLQRAMRLLEDSGEIRTLALVGGVAANQELRLRLASICDSRGWSMVVPPPRLCTDQGAMSAWAGVERLLMGSSDERSTEVYARYPFTTTMNSM